MSEKEKLLFLAKIIIDNCSQKEIQILCTELLSADLKCRLQKDDEV